MGKRAISMATRQPIIGMRASGRTYREIAAHFNVSLTCVTTTIQNHRQQGTVADKPRCGRPSKLTDRDQRSVVVESRRNPAKSVPQLTASLNRRLINKVTTRTVQNILTKHKLRSYRVFRKPLSRAEQIGQKD